MLRVAFYIGLASLGHFVWEAVQLPLYTLWQSGTRQEIVTALIHCAGGDILITAVTLALAGALARHFHWPSFGWRMVFTAIVLGAAYTVFSEWLNVAIRRSWSYTAATPVLPLLATGLTPLLQWVVVPGLAFGIMLGRGGEGRLHLQPPLCYAGIIDVFKTLRSCVLVP